MYWTRLQYSRQTHTHTHGNDLKVICSRLREVHGKSLVGEKYTQPQKREEAELVVRYRKWDSGEVGWARSRKVSNRKSVQKELEGSAGESCM